MLIPSDIKLYLYTEVTDMRKSIDGLCILVVDALNMHPASGSLFLFRNRRGDKLKALYYERNCFTLWYRRLEKGRFIFPRNASGGMELSAEHFAWILSSDKYSRIDAMTADPPEEFF